MLQKDIKEVYKKIKEAISFTDQIKEVKRIAAIDIIFSKEKIYCAALVFSYPDLKLLEKRSLKSKEIIKHSPSLVGYREGVPIIETYKLLENEPDVILISKPGTIDTTKISSPAYVGVLLNKPTIGISDELVFGRLDVDKIMFQDQERGLAIRSKEHSKPIYIAPGYGLSIEKAVEITKNCLGEYKYPLPLHLAHKKAIKIKKEN